MASNSSGKDTYSPLLGLWLATSLKIWADRVFQPALVARSFGRSAPVNQFGVLPPPGRFRGGGPELSKLYSEPVFLEDRPDHYASVEAFDEMSDAYEDVVRPFSQPIFEDAVAFLEPHLTPDARILDPSAGPGREARMLARLVPDGEVVAADLSRGMVTHAHRQARAAGVDNMAFFQADVSNPPAIFEGYFDVVFCCLAFHHYPDGLGAVKAFRRVLAPGGKVIIADPGPAWFNDMSRPFAKLTDPGFVQHRTAAEFQALFRSARFSQFYWAETLPGIGITVASA